MNVHTKNDNEALNHLKCCLQREVMVSEKDFSWLRTLHKAIKCPDRRYHFWWRIANYLYTTKKHTKLARSINLKLRNKYSIDIELGAKIGPDLHISHYVGIVITGYSEIGSNFHIKQNVTIGVHHSGQKGKIFIGDNIEIGANSCIIGDDISIGNNVFVGAMSFINKDIPSDSIVYTQKINTLIKRTA